MFDFRKIKRESYFASQKLKYGLSGDLKLPNFLVIGAPKCGTTSLHYYLRKHKQIFLPKQKELHFHSVFGLEDSEIQKELYPMSTLLDGIVIRDYKTYKLCFVGANSFKAVGEITPSYYLNPYRLKASLEKYGMDSSSREPKLILILRDPVEASWSHYTMQINNGVEILSFTDFLKVEESRLRVNNYRRCHCHSFMYYEHLRKLFGIFKRENTLILKFEDLVDNPQSVLNSVFDFLNLERFVLSDSKIYNEGNYRKANLDLELRLKLQDLYRDDIYRLSNLLGMSFEVWLDKWI